jgi:RNA polymerase sigma factor (sigma-70 family)
MFNSRPDWTLVNQGSPMADDSEFFDFVGRIRAGDQQAAAELVRRYEPAIRLEVQMRLRDTRLRRAFDASDVCQSVLASFFVRVAAGQYDLESPEGLTGLLVRMARNKLASQARRHTNSRRDVRRTSAAEGEPNVVATCSTPSREIEMRDLLQQFRNHLSDDERQLADARSQGKSWNEIAMQLGGDPRALCKRLERAVDRVCQELDLSDG